MAMTKVVSLKVPDEAEGLQARLGLAAKKVGIPAWELLTRMLDVWDQQHDDQSGESSPAGESWEEWKANIEAEVRALRAELDAVKSQGGYGLPVNQEIKEGNGIPVNHKIEIIEPEEQKPDLSPIMDEGLEPGGNGLPVDQVNLNTESDIEAFEAAYAALERDQHTVIWKLREALSWSVERFDNMLCRLRDDGRYQLQAGDTEHMTKKQIKAGFTDENGFHFLTVMRFPQPETPRTSVDDTDIEASGDAPIGATAVDELTLETSAVPPTSRRRGRPRKQQQEAEKATPLIPSAEFFSEVVQSVQAAEPETQAKEEAPSALSAPRRRGRPPKAQK
jgi:hypothetical protein